MWLHGRRTLRFRGVHLRESSSPERRIFRGPGCGWILDDGGQDRYGITKRPGSPFRSATLCGVKLLSRLIRLPLRLVPVDRVVRILSGELRGSKWITSSATHGCWIGTYERETQRAFQQMIRKGSVVLDIGANAGFFTLLAAKQTGPQGAVFSFEPLPRNLDYLRRHIALNRATNVQVLPIALASQSGFARFGTAANPAMGALTAEGELEVRTESLDELVVSGRVAPPHFLKIDVEGAEFGVLTGAAAVLASHRPFILLSTHGYREHERCCAFLRDLQYELRDLRDGTSDGQYTVLASAVGEQPHSGSRLPV